MTHPPDEVNPKSSPTTRSFNWLGFADRARGDRRTALEALIRKNRAKLNQASPGLGCVVCGSELASNSSCPQCDPGLTRRLSRLDWWKLIHAEGPFTWSGLADRTGLARPTCQGHVNQLATIVVDGVPIVTTNPIESHVEPDASVLPESWCTWTAAGWRRHLEGRAD